MSKYLQYCQKCKDEKLPDGVKCPGYKVYLSDDVEVCEYGHELVTLNVPSDDFINVWFDISQDSNFYDAMIKLHDEDIIEYELKMSQFRNQVNSQQSNVSASVKVHCPKCNSTDIGVTTKGYTLLTGFLGSGKTMNYCKSCGHKW